MLFEHRAGRYAVTSVTPPHETAWIIRHSLMAGQGFTPPAPPASSWLPGITALKLQVLNLTEQMPRPPPETGHCTLPPTTPAAKLARRMSSRRFERHPSLERCPFPWHRINLESSTQLACTLFHASDANSLALAQVRQIEPTTFVSHANLQSVVGPSQIHQSFLHPAVLLQIPKPFLNDTKNTQGCLWIH